VLQWRSISISRARVSRSPGDRAVSGPANFMASPGHIPSYRGRASYGRGREFESRRPRYPFSNTCRLGVAFSGQQRPCCLSPKEAESVSCYSAGVNGEHC